MRSPSGLRTLNEIDEPLTLPPAMVTAEPGSPVCCTVPFNTTPVRVRSNIHGAPGTSVTCQRPAASPPVEGVAVFERTGGAGVDAAPPPELDSRTAVN